MIVHLTLKERRAIRDAIRLMKYPDKPKIFDDLLRRFDYIGQVFAPGQAVPESGVYRQVDPSLDPVGEFATCVKGEPFPPTNGQGYCWALDAPTDGEPGE